MIHVVCGPIGAGKTTYAKQLAKEQNAICFSEDEWLARLFVPDAPEGLLREPMEVVGAWATEKYLRCRSQIWQVCLQLLDADTSIVLDGAAATKEQRDKIRQKAKDSNVGFKLHYVTASVELRHKRVFERNEKQGESYSLEVTPAMFEFTEQFFQPPVGNELYEVKIIET
ncbi:Predicted kinase [Alteromonadaceae bacterium Bs31]|nr:Predicted kinase [Alteromonadaceae bacterium Bs31]